MSELVVYDQDKEVKCRIPQCFGCWKQLLNESALLISPPSETSSDNVNHTETFRLCEKCFDGVLEFIMGDESPNYKKGMPTLIAHHNKGVEK